MYICPNCNNTSETATNFCGKCGTPMVEKVEAAVQPAYQEPVYQQPVQQPVYQEPVYQQPAYQEPVYQQPVYQEPVQNTNQPSLGKVITGMALAIAGMLFAFIGFITVAQSIDWAYESLVYGIIFFVIAFPLSLVGLILSNSSINAGSTSGMAKAGKIVGLIAVILSGLVLLLGIIGGATGSSHIYSYYDYYY